MTDFYSFDEFSIPLWIKALFWGLYMVVFVYAVWKLLLTAPKNKRHVNASYWILPYFIVFAVFYCVNDDYFSYRSWLRVPTLVDWHKEQVYAYIIMFCRSLPTRHAFEVFRLIVWGGALLLVFGITQMGRRFLNPGLVVLCLFVFFSGHFSYARASLAMAMFLMGVGICMWVKHPLAKILGVGVAICSYFFHHELLIGIALLPCMLLPFEWKRAKKYSLILFAIIIAGIIFINSNLGFLEDVFGNDELADKIEHFNEQEQRVFRMSTLINYLNIFYPFTLITLFFHKHKRRRKAVAGMYRITFVLLMVTVAFFIVSGERSVYAYRVLYITTIPLSIMIAYCYNQGFFKKYQLVIMLFWAFLTNSVRLINSI